MLLFNQQQFFHCHVGLHSYSLCFLHRDLNRSDSESSLCISQAGEQLRLSASYGGSKVLMTKPTSLMHDPGSRVDETGPQPLHGHTPNGGGRVQDVYPEAVPDSPILMKKIYGIEKSASLGEINSAQAVQAVQLSMSESSRSLSPNSTDPDTPSPTGLPGVAGYKVNSRIPQLSAKKSPLEDDSTGEDTDSIASRKKHTFTKIFKKQRK